MKRRQKELLCIGLGAAVLIVGLTLLVLSGNRGHTVTTFSMGSYVQQTVYGKNREEAAKSAASAVQKLENLISWRVENSDIFRLNEEAGKEFISIDSETESILSAALEVCEASGGAFDVTIAPVSRLWDFDENPHVPDSALLEKFAKKVDYQTLSLPGDGTAALRKLDTALDLGAVGKGAACDAAVDAYEESGAEYGIVAVGGSVGVYGQKPWGKPWTVAVRDPKGDGTLGTVALMEGFVSTSGSYEKRFTEGGVAYHHILDPETGYPAESGLVSVTVKSGSGVLSDALSTACFVLGLEKSLPLLEKFDAQAVFINENDNIYVTEGWKEDFALTSSDYTLEELP